MKLDFNELMSGVTEEMRKCAEHPFVAATRSTFNPNYKAERPPGARPLGSFTPSHLAAPGETPAQTNHEDSPELKRNISWWRKNTALDPGSRDVANKAWDLTKAYNKDRSTTSDWYDSGILQAKLRGDTEAVDRLTAEKNQQLGAADTQHTQARDFLHKDYAKQRNAEEAYKEYEKLNQKNLAQGFDYAKQTGNVEAVPKPGLPPTFPKDNRYLSQVMGQPAAAQPQTPPQTGQGEKSSIPWYGYTASGEHDYSGTGASDATQKIPAAPATDKQQESTEKWTHKLPLVGGTLKNIDTVAGAIEGIKNIPTYINKFLTNTFGQYGNLALPVGILGFLALQGLFKRSGGGGGQNININLGGGHSGFASSGVSSLGDKFGSEQYKQADMVTDALANAVKNRIANKVLDKVITEPKPAREQEDKKLEIVSKYPEMAALLKDEQNKAYLERLMKENA